MRAKSLIKRHQSNAVREYLSIFPVVAILGARQVGKTTLAKQIVSESYDDSVYLDLENRADLSKLDEPELYFKQNRNKLIIIDEVQLKPEIFRVLRGCVDENDQVGQFIILGSASPELLRQSSETLAGRIGYLELTPFLLDEIEDDKKLWFRGGFPRSYLASNDKASVIWRNNFIKTFLQRDIPMLGISISPIQLEQFWEMIAHSHAQCFNASKIAQNFGISVPTVKRHLALLEGTYMVRTLQPYHANLKRRVVKTPKVYIRDTGILHALLNIRSIDNLYGHPSIGASYEGWVIEQICSALDNDEYDFYFYRTHAGAEIDLLIKSPCGFIAVEIKHSLAPKISRGFHETVKEMGIKQAYVIYPGDECYPVTSNIEVVTLGEFINNITTN